MQTVEKASFADGGGLLSVDRTVENRGKTPFFFHNTPHIHAFNIQSTHTYHNLWIQNRYASRFLMSSTTEANDSSCSIIFSMRRQALRAVVWSVRSKSALTRL